jgi:hypothetical protein
VDRETAQHIQERLKRDKPGFEKRENARQEEQNKREARENQLLRERAPEDRLTTAERAGRVVLARTELRKYKAEYTQGIKDRAVVERSADRLKAQRVEARSRLYAASLDVQRRDTPATRAAFNAELARYLPLRQQHLTAESMLQAQTQKLERLDNLRRAASTVIRSRGDFVVILGPERATFLAGQKPAAQPVEARYAPENAQAALRSGPGSAPQGVYAGVQRGADGAVRVVGVNSAAYGQTSLAAKF